MKSARLHITALGLDECLIDGRVVGDDLFAPGWTDYRTCVQYMVYDVAGIDIDPTQPAYYKYAILRPQPGGELTQAKGAVQTPYGDLSSEWRLDGGTFTWDITVPPNTTATA